MRVLEKQHFDIAVDLFLGDGAITEVFEDLNEALEANAAKSIHHQLDECHVVLH